MDLSNILEYQKKDGELIKIERELASNPSRKIFSEMVAIVKKAQEKSGALEQRAGNLAKDYEALKKAYDESQKEIEEENKKAEESISNLTVINVSKMKELFSSNDTKIIFVGSLTCPHCTAIKPVINSVVKDLNV